MSDETILLDEEVKGVRAKEIIENETFKQAIKNLKDTYLNEMIKTNIHEDEARKYLWMSYHNIDKIVAQLEQVMTTGALAREQIKKIKTYS